MKKEITKANEEEIKCLKGKIEKLQREKIFYQILIEQLSEKGNEKMNVTYKTSTAGSNPLKERDIDLKHFEEFIPLLLVDENSNLERTCDETHTILRFSKKNNPDNFFEFKITREEGR